MKKIIIIFLLIFSNIIFASDFEKANALYKTKKYNEAIKIYQKINDVNAYYNLGNCYFKLNDLGMALYYYKRAYQYNPRNEKIKHNIEIIRRLRKDKFNVKKNTLHSLYDKLQLSYSINEGIIILLIIFTILIIFLIIRNFYYLRFLKKIIISLIIFLLFILFVFILKFNRNIEGVIIANEAFVYSEPVETDKSIVKLHSATEIEIVTKNKNWSEIIIAGIKKGWIQNKNFITLRRD